MRKPACALLLALVIPAAASAFMSPADQQALQSIQQSFPKWTSVYLRITKSGTGSFFEIWENSLRIRFSADKNSLNYFRFNGSADGKFLNLTAIPLESKDPAQGYRLTGSGAELTIDQNGNTYYVTGDVDMKYINFSLSPFGEGGYNIWGQGGMNLSATTLGKDLTVSGSVDLNQFDAKRVALLAAALTVVNETRTLFR